MHDCAAGRACRDALVDTETHRREPALIEQERGLCKGCQRAVRRAIRELPDDYEALNNAKRLVKGQLAVSLTPDPVVPIHVAASALQYELAEWAEAAMVLVSNKLSVKPELRQKLRGYPVHNWPVVAQASRVLTPNIELLLDTPAKPVRVWQASGMAWELREMDGIDVALKMQRAHSKVKGVLGESNPRRRLTMPCPVDDCGMPTLGINNGETDVTCTSCGGRWSEAEYEWFAGMITGGLGEKEIGMLRWLLAESRWLLDESIAREVVLSEKLSKTTKLANMDLSEFDIATVQAMLREILEERELCNGTSSTK